MSKPSVSIEKRAANHWAVFENKEHYKGRVDITASGLEFRRSVSREVLAEFPTQAEAHNWVRKNKRKLKQ